MPGLRYPLRSEGHGFSHANMPNKIIIAANMCAGREVAC